MNKFNVIPILADILSDSVKEKVTRIVLAVFRNLIEKPEDKQVVYCPLLYIKVISLIKQIFDTVVFLITYTTSIFNSAIHIRKIRVFLVYEQVILLELLKLYIYL